MGSRAECVSKTFFVVHTFLHTLIPAYPVLMEMSLKFAYDSGFRKILYSVVFITFTSIFLNSLDSPRNVCMLVV